jgi:hypothetical protein
MAIVLVAVIGDDQKITFYATSFGISQNMLASNLITLANLPAHISDPATIQRLGHRYFMAKKGYCHNCKMTSERIAEFANDISKMKNQELERFPAGFQFDPCEFCFPQFDMSYENSPWLYTLKNLSILIQIHEFGKDHMRIEKFCKLLSSCPRSVACEFLRHYAQTGRTPEVTLLMHNYIVEEKPEELACLMWFFGTVESRKVVLDMLFESHFSLVVNRPPIFFMLVEYGLIVQEYEKIFAASKCSSVREYVSRFTRHGLAG